MDDYRTLSDEELRRWLDGSPLDVGALVEAAARFFKQTEDEDRIFKCADCGSYDVEEG